VVLVARREAELNSAAQECPSETLVTPGDVTDEVFAAKVFEEAVKKFGTYRPTHNLRYSFLTLVDREGRCFVQRKCCFDYYVLHD
jgi:hypothetical protein